MKPLTPPEPVVEAAIRIDSHLGGAHERSLAEDVLDGLTRPFKELPPKHFYDARGAELFDHICELPEYYPTRAERAILEEAAVELASADQRRRARRARLGHGRQDAGAARRDARRRHAHALHPGGRHREHGARLRRGAHRRVPGAAGARRDRGLRAPPRPRARPASGPRIVAFLGGTIGNFPPGSRRRVLREIARLLGPEDHLLMGTDLVKDPEVLEAAYDDAQGVTADFNRNVLRVLNRELDADFDPEDFDHVALFDPEHEWIEMRLRARREHTTLVRALDLPVHFDAGEEMRTEISAKFTPERLEGDLSAAGLELVRWLTDPEELFALTLSKRSDAS